MASIIAQTSKEDCDPIERPLGRSVSSSVVTANGSGAPSFLIATRRHVTPPRAQV